MSGCAVSILYFCVILPGAMAADVFLGGNGIFSALGIIAALVLYGTRTPSPESPPAPPASDDLTSLRQLVYDLQQQVNTLRGELRQLQAKVAHQPRAVNTMPLRLAETPQAVSAEMPKHFPPPASAAAQAAAPSDDWQLPDLDDFIITPTKAAASAAPPKPVRPRAAAHVGGGARPCQLSVQLHLLAAGGDVLEPAHACLLMRERRVAPRDRTSACP